VGKIEDVINPFFLSQSKSNSQVCWINKHCGNKIWRTSKLLGFQCCSQLRNFRMNIIIWFWRCIKMPILINQVPHNLELLCDLEVLLGISCIVPMLEQFNELIKFSHFWKCFVCDFVVAIKLC
jgi:hypothetical protein